MIKTTIYLSEELDRAIKMKAKKSGSSQAEIIRSALTDAVVIEKPRLPTSFGSASSGEIGSDRLEEWLDENWSAD